MLDTSIELLRNNNSSVEKNPLKKLFQPIKQEAEYARDEIRRSFQKTSQKSRESLLNPIKQEAEHAKDELRRSFLRSKQKGRALLNNFSFDKSNHGSDGGEYDATPLRTNAQYAVDEAIRISSMLGPPATVETETKPKSRSVLTTAENLYIAKRQSMRNAKDELSSTNHVVKEAKQVTPEKSSSSSSTSLTTTEKLYMAKRRSMRNVKDALEPSIERATVQRNNLLLKKMMIEETSDELDTIQRYLGVCEKGKCLRHPNQIICGKIVEHHHFALVHECRVCSSEQMAGGGKRHRKSMAPLINAIKTMQKDRRQWREKTKLMHHGRGYSSDEDSLSSQDGRSSTGTKSFDGMMSFRISTDGEAALSSDDGDEIFVDDEKWKDEVSARVAQVRAWDGNAALKCNPIYAKYFRMQNYGIPIEAIKQSCEMDGWDPRILDLDPNLPLQDQLMLNKALTEEEKEDMLYYANHTTDDFDGDLGDIYEIVERIHEAYCKRKEVFDNHQIEEIKKKEAKKWIGQDWGNLLQKPRERTPIVKEEKESDIERELRLLEEAELRRQVKEEEEAAAPTSPIKMASSHSDLMSPSARSHSTLGPLPNFFNKGDFDDISLGESDVETKDDDESDFSELCSSQGYDGSSSQQFDSFSDLSGLTEALSSSPTKRNRKHKKGTTMKVSQSPSKQKSPRKKNKKKVDFSSDNDSCSIEVPSKPKSRRLGSSRKPISEKKLRSINFDIPTIRKPKSEKKLRGLISEGSLSTDLDTPTRKPKSKKKLRITSDSSSNMDFDTPIHKPKSKKKLRITSDSSSNMDFDTPIRKPKSKKKLRIASGSSSNMDFDTPIRKPKSKKKLRITSDSSSNMDFDTSIRKPKSKKKLRMGSDDIDLDVSTRKPKSKKTLRISSDDSLSNVDLNTSSRKPKSKKKQQISSDYSLSMDLDTIDRGPKSKKLLLTSAKKKNDSTRMVGFQYETEDSIDSIDPLASFSSDAMKTDVLWSSHTRSTDSSTKYSVDMDGPKDTSINRILTEKNIVITSLIKQVRTLQLVMDEMQKQREVGTEGDNSQEETNALKSELALCKQSLSEKDTILSSLIAHIQNLKTILEGKDQVISSQATQIENIQSQLLAKDKVIFGFQKELKGKYNDKFSKSSPSSFANASVEPKQDNAKRETQPKELDDIDSDLDDDSSLDSNSSFANASPLSELPRNYSKQRDAESEPSYSGWYFPASQRKINTPSGLKTNACSKDREILLKPESSMPHSAVLNIVEGKDMSNITCLKSGGETIPAPRQCDGSCINCEATCATKERKFGEEPSMSMAGRMTSRKKKSKKDEMSVSCHAIMIKGNPYRQSHDVTNLEPKKQKSSEGKKGKRKKISQKKKKSQKTKRKENLDSTCLRAKFKGAVNKTIGIKRLMNEDEHANAVANELKADRNSFRRSSSKLSDWVAPVDWNQYFSDEDEEEENKLGDNLEPIREPKIQCRNAPSRFSPALSIRPSAELKATKSILRAQSDASNSIKCTKCIQWIGDDILHQKILINRISSDLKNDIWYTDEEMKIFALEKFMEDHPHEFELVESDDDDDEYTYTSCNSCSYIEEEITDDEYELQRPESLELLRSLSSRSIRSL